MPPSGDPPKGRRNVRDLWVCGKCLGYPASDLEMGYAQDQSSRQLVQSFLKNVSR